MIIWYLSQCVASWRSLSWKGLGQRWPWSQVWLSDWWTGSPVAACGRTGVSVAGPVSSQVEGVALEGKTRQMHHLTTILQDLKVPGFNIWLLQPNLGVNKWCSTWKQLVVQVEDRHTDGFGRRVHTWWSGELVAHHATPPWGRSGRGWKCTLRLGLQAWWHGQRWNKDTSQTC